MNSYVLSLLYFVLPLLLPSLCRGWEDLPITKMKFADGVDACDEDRADMIETDILVSRQMADGMS